MKIVAISDLHGHLPQLPEADVICIVGDIIPTKYNKDIDLQWKWYTETYLPWVATLPARKVITVGGNHDKFYDMYEAEQTERHIFLNNSEVEIDGYSFYGTPNISRLNEDLSFKPYDEELDQLFRHIPERLDFLLCHHAPYGANGCGFDIPFGFDIGCRELAKVICNKDIGYIFCGHIHTGNHSMGEWQGKMIANVSYSNEDKIPAYEPLIIEL